MKKIGLSVFLLLFYGCNSNIIKSLGVSSSDSTVIQLDKKLEWVNNTNVALVRASDQIRVRYAERYCNNLNYANKNDWRLPTVYELQSARDVIANFTEGIRYGGFWSSSSPVGKPKNKYSVSIDNLSTGYSYIGGSDTSSVLCTRDLTSAEVKTLSKSKNKIVKSNLKLINPSENACIKGGGEFYRSGRCKGNSQEAVYVCKAMGLRVPSFNELDNLAVTCGATFAYNGTQRKSYMNSSYNSCVNNRGAIEGHIWTTTSAHSSRNMKTYYLYGAKGANRYKLSNVSIQCVK